MATEKPDAIVVFGVTGDLADKKIFPALHALVRRGHLKEPIIGVAKTERTPEQIRAKVRESLENHGGVDSQTLTNLLGLLRYVSGDYRDPATFERLRKALGSAARPLSYLAIPPSLFATVIEGLAKSGCVDGASVVVEKPFGRNLASAQALNRTLHNYFPDQAIFRIDHYLGKEPVQNLIYFRFANPFFEAGWNRHSIQRVQITMAERFGVAGRGRFYEEVGAIRDVVQNHLLMVIACLAMEQPSGRDHESIREERVKVLKMIRPLIPSDIVRGSSVAIAARAAWILTPRSRRSQRSDSTSTVSGGQECRSTCARQVPFCHGHRSPGRVQAAMLSRVGRDRTTVAELFSLPAQPRRDDRLGHQDQSSGRGNGGRAN